MAAPSITRDRTPNFPTPPVKNISSLSMPNDLVADGRNFYTEVFFIDYRSAAYGAASIAGIPIAETLNSIFDPNSTAATATGGGVIGGIGGAIAGGISGGIGGAIAGGVAGSVGGSLLGYLSTTGGAALTGSIRLPIPRTINDITVLNWEQLRGIDFFTGLLGPTISQAVGKGGQAVGALIGKAINPMLFLAFNHQNFREFTFEWVLAPTTKKESETIRQIVNLFKNSSLPTRNLVMDYPLIAMVNMSPKNLNGHMKFKPMAIQTVAVNYTPNPTGPGFFGEADRSDGAPTMVTLTVKFVEIKLWYRGEVK